MPGDGPPQGDCPVLEARVVPELRLVEGVVAVPVMILAAERRDEPGVGRAEEAAQELTGQQFAAALAQDPAQGTAVRRFGGREAGDEVLVMA